MDFLASRIDIEKFSHQLMLTCFAYCCFTLSSFNIFTNVFSSVAVLIQALFSFLFDWFAAIILLSPHTNISSNEKLISA